MSGEFVGTLTSARLLMAKPESVLDLLVSGQPVSISEDSSLEEIIRISQEHHLKEIPVTDGHGRLVGLVDTAKLPAAHGTPARHASLAVRPIPIAPIDTAGHGGGAEQHAADELAPWDIAYYSEKLRQQRYSITQEEVKPYFPVTRVVPGMFEVVGRLYGVSFEEVQGVDIWHPDVSFYEIRDHDGSVRGQFYFDLITFIYRHIISTP